MSCSAIILAAGKGTRMSSDLPKVLHEILERPMVSYVVDAVRPVCSERLLVVVGYGAEQVRERCKDDGVEFVLQEQQLGTGHAVLQCESALADVDGTVVVLNGDVPCLQTSTIERFVEYHRSERAAATVLTAELDNPAGYGRIVRDPSDGALLAIVEQKDATPAQTTIREINSGLFCFDKGKLFEFLHKTGRDNAQSEYYLTDVIGLMQQGGEIVRAFRVDDSHEVSGVNTDAELDSVRSYIEGQPH